jgi:vacuolar protein sorting-associated protein 33A
MDSLLVEQEFMNGIDTDKVHPYIEDQIAQKVDLVKVSSHFYYTRNA